MRSAMWAMGRYDTSRLPENGLEADAAQQASTVQATLRWVIITPLGGPVVPEV